LFYLLHELTTFQGEINNSQQPDIFSSTCHPEYPQEKTEDKCYWVY